MLFANFIRAKALIPEKSLTIWRQDGNGSKTPLKGLQLTDAEASALCDALKEYNGGTYE